MAAASGNALANQQVPNNSAALVVKYSNSNIHCYPCRINNKKQFINYTEEAKHRMPNFKQQYEHLKQCILNEHI